MNKIEVKILNENAIIEGERMMVAGARLTQRGHNIKSMDDFATINGIYSKYFEKDCPARSCVEISRLPKDVLLEMEAIAVK